MTQARVAARATVRQLAAKLKVHHSAVSHWEGGRRSISAVTVYQVGRLLGVTPQWLAGLSDDGGPGTRKVGGHFPAPTWIIKPKARPPRQRDARGRLLGREAAAAQARAAEPGAGDACGE